MMHFLPASECDLHFEIDEIVASWLSVPVEVKLLVGVSVSGIEAVGVEEAA